MHVKYAFLQDSYSAPVRVSVVARATTLVARAVVAFRAVVPRDVCCVVFCVAVLDTVFCVGATRVTVFVVGTVVRTR